MKDPWNFVHSTVVARRLSGMQGPRPWRCQWCHCRTRGVYLHRPGWWQSPQVGVLRRCQSVTQISRVTCRFVVFAKMIWRTERTWQPKTVHVGTGMILPLVPRSCGVAWPDDVRCSLLLRISFSMNPLTRQRSL